MKITPLGDRVVVKPIKQEDVTKGGIVLPDSAKEEKSEKGEVIAVGPGKMLDNGQRQPVSLTVGQNVLFTKYGPDEIKLDGEDYLIVKEEDIMGIIE